MNSDNREYVNWDADIPVIRYKALDDTGCELLRKNRVFSC